MLSRPVLCWPDPLVAARSSARPSHPTIFCRSPCRVGRSGTQQCLDRAAFGHRPVDHPTVGRLDLGFEAMPLPADPGLTITAYSVQPGTPTHEALPPAGELRSESRRCPYRPGKP
ncbi:hypothetical protein [Plantactinospora sp. BC1]|uniref:MmyB family transcriptional regulator n=1 Tax=Plantactinospora sp. BC1 TaxID=2108470 RepID=UPI0018FE22C3